MTEPNSALAAAITTMIAAASTIGQAFGIDPTMLAWGAMGGGWAIARNRTDKEHRIRRAVVVAIGAAITAAAVGGAAIVLIERHMSYEAVPPLRMALGFLLGLGAQKLADVVPDLIGTLFTAIGDRMRRLIAGTDAPAAQPETPPIDGKQGKGSDDGHG